MKPWKRERAERERIQRQKEDERARLLEKVGASQPSPLKTSMGSLRVTASLAANRTTLMANAITAASISAGQITSTYFYPSYASAPPRQTNYQLEPIKVWKIASFSLTYLEDKSVIGLQGVGMPVSYDWKQPAKCHISHGVMLASFHRAPDPSCTCGFYAVDEQWLPSLTMGSYQWDCLLEVELFGTVIKHERGYRASNMRVMTCWLREVMLREIHKMPPMMTVQNIDPIPIRKELRSFTPIRHPFTLDSEVEVAVVERSLGVPVKVMTEDMKQRVFPQVGNLRLG